MSYRSEKSETLHQGRVFDLLRDEVRYPDGRLATFEVLRHGGAVAMLAQDEGGELLFVRQYRHAIGERLLEIPAGRLEAGEEPLQTAQRELKEEVGMAAAKWRELGSFLVAPGYSDEVIHLFYASELSPEALPQDEDEAIEVVRLSPEEARKQLREGGIRDAKSALALKLAGALLD